MSRTTFCKYASVILDVSVDKILDYGIPAEMEKQIKKGVRVEVPVRGQLCNGYVIEIKDTPNFHAVKPISKVISDIELLDIHTFELALWMAKYYCAPLRQVFKVLLPAPIRKEGQHKQQLFVMRAKTKEQLIQVCIEMRKSCPAQANILDVMLKAKKGMLLTELLEESKGSRASVDSLAKKGHLVLDIVRIDRSPLVNEEYFQTKSKALNEEQAIALNKIVDCLKNNRFETHLLFGVTGSGKTEVYLQAIEQALQQNKGTIMLVPEIALTAQTIERFRSRFEGKIAILHHRLSQGERFDEWHRIRRGEARIVIGARSAIFSPVVNLGLIIVDEEHEQSYKQTEEVPCYHARDVAVMRGKMTNSAVILGSATPSLESYYNALKGKYILSTLKGRADAATMPKVEIIDMKVEFEKAKGYTNFSGPLLDGIKKRMELGEQTILFLNRRGYHTTMMCKQCGTSMRCEHCDLALTFHYNDNTLSCHLCGFTIAPPPKQCPSCKSPDTMKFKGVGTEQIERSLHAIFPGIRTIRMDADTTRHKGSHQKLFRAFGSGKADVLIGTQMVAKGLHFPEVTLVGVLNSDSSLNIPDFRASENSFQLITQVAGRAGRGVTPGEVILQTSMPDNSTIRLASAQDYEKFYEEEISTRQLFRYPPFVSMAKIAFSGDTAEKTASAANLFREQLLTFLDNKYELNPVIPAGYAKVKDKYRYQFLIRGPSIFPITRGIEAIRQTMKYPADIKIFIDINPTSTYF